MAVIDDKEILRVIDVAIKRFDGNPDILGSAIGTLHINRVMSWKALYLIYIKFTI